MKSAANTEAAKVKFINKSSRYIEIVWIGYNGQLTRYKCLEPHQFVDVNTYTNHPWIAVDSITRDNLNLNNKEIFVVDNFKCDIKLGTVQRTVTQADVRIPVFITIPLHSLKNCAIRVVRDLIKSTVNINFLELPDILKYELEKSFVYKSKNCNILER